MTLCFDKIITARFTVLSCIMMLLCVHWYSSPQVSCLVCTFYRQSTVSMSSSYILIIAVEVPCEICNRCSSPQVSCASCTFDTVVQKFFDSIRMNVLN